MRITDSLSLATLFGGAALFAAIASAQTCNLPDVNVGGYYAYTALGAGSPGFFTMPSGTTGTSGTGTTGTGTGSGTSGTSGTGTTGTGTTGSGTSGTSGTGTTTGSGTSTSSSSGYSNTELGMLLSGVSNPSAPFASSGTLYLDGAGNVLASSNSQVGAIPSTMVVGSYTLYANCTISVSLTDAFGTQTTPSMLQGIVLSGGGEIDLALLQSSSSSTTGTGTSGTGTSGTGTTGSGTTTSSGPSGFFESGVLIKLVRPAFQTCSTSELSGSYALIGTGTGGETGTTTSASGTTSGSVSEGSFFFLGLAQFDGNGHVVTPASTSTTSGSSSTSGSGIGSGTTSTTGSSSGTSAPSTGTSSMTGLNYLQFTGSYTVNPDCSGAMTLSATASGMALTSSGTTSTTGTGTSGTGTSGTGTSGTGTTAAANPSLTIEFVMSPATLPVNQNASSARYAEPELNFSLANGSSTILGYGIAQ